ncbi:redoxin domain-containing protein [Arsukibacterium sp.]|uniref:redoxin domain-containing protein n=1 Tax=Arsukibacterium sp. TaxID=1977258 RepID=UPI002FDA76B5
MKRQPGDKLTHVVLPALDGQLFDTRSLEGRPFMLSFFRFASCPFCNLRMHELVTRFNEFADDFTIVAVFDSPLDNLQRHANPHHAPFAVLADENNHFYQEYGIEYSLLGVVKGMLFRMPTMLRAMMRGYLPLRIKGRMTTMPADFLIDRSGRIIMAYYGSDEGDHLPFERVKSFSASETRASGGG